MCFGYCKLYHDILFDIPPTSAKNKAVCMFPINSVKGVKTSHEALHILYTQVCCSLLNQDMWNVEEDQTTFWPFIKEDPQELACKGDDHKHQQHFPHGSEPIASQPAHPPTPKK